MFPGSPHNNPLLIAAARREWGTSVERIAAGREWGTPVERIAAGREWGTPVEQIEWNK